MVEFQENKRSIFSIYPKKKAIFDNLHLKYALVFVGLNLNHYRMVVQNKISYVITYVT